MSQSGSTKDEKRSGGAQTDKLSHAARVQGSGYTHVTPERKGELKYEARLGKECESQSLVSSGECEFDLKGTSTTSKKSSIAGVCTILTNILARTRSSQAQPVGPESDPARNGQEDACGNEVCFFPGETFSNLILPKSLPKISWPECQCEMDSIFSAVFNCMANSSEEIRPLLAVLVALTRASDSDCCIHADKQEKGLDKIQVFASARAWLTHRLISKLEEVEIETKKLKSNSKILPFSAIFYVLEAIKEIGFVPGVIERLGKFTKNVTFSSNTGAPTTSNDSNSSYSLSDSDGESLDGHEDPQRCPLSLSESPLFSMALDEVLQSLIIKK